MALWGFAHGDVHSTVPGDSICRNAVEGQRILLPEFCTAIRAFSPKAAWEERWFKTTGPCVSNPLPGGEEAEGFGVGVHDQEPTPALRDRCRCAPPLQGGIFSRPANSRAKFRSYLFSLRFFPGGAR
jgi:hypothetical protein